jgi:Cytochrome P460
MIDAYKAGIPGDGKPFPEGAKMAKVHWNAQKKENYPSQPLVSATQHDVDFMVKDSKRFADSGGWGYAEFECTLIRVCDRDGKRLVIEKATEVPNFTHRDLVKALRKARRGLIDLGTPEIL